MQIEPFIQLTVFPLTAMGEVDVKMLTASAIRDGKAILAILVSKNWVLKKTVYNLR